jgi:hypothetical protein
MRHGAFTVIENDILDGLFRQEIVLQFRKSSGFPQLQKRPRAGD